MDNPRHFKLKVTTFDSTIFRLFFNSFVTPNIFKDGEHLEVIEYSAYEQLKKENESLKEEIQGWMRKVSQKEHSIVDWENYVAREKNENYKLKSKLKLAVEFIKCISVDVTKREMILKEIES